MTVKLEFKENQETSVRGLGIYQSASAAARARVPGVESEAMGKPLGVWRGVAQGGTFPPVARPNGKDRVVVPAHLVGTWFAPTRGHRTEESK